MTPLYTLSNKWADKFCSACTNNSVLETKDEWVGVRFCSRGEVPSIGLAGSLSGDNVTKVG